MLEIRTNEPFPLQEAEMLFSDTLKVLLKRSEHDPQMWEVMIGFIKALNMKVHVGSSDENLASTKIEKLKEILSYTASELRISEGGSVSDAQRVHDYLKSKR